MTDRNWKERIVAMLSVRDQLYKADKDEKIKQAVLDRLYNRRKTNE